MSQQQLDYRESIRVFSKLPYKQNEYKSRAWGHPLHFLLSYPSKLKPSLAHFLIRLFTEKNQIVLDPFSGSGTLPFEACCQGRIGIGTDINPLAFHTTQAKVGGISNDKLELQVTELENFIKTNVGKFTKVEDEIVEYYHKNTLDEILSSRQFFLQNPKKDYSFLISCISHILHGNRPYALSRRSHNIMPWPPKGPTTYKPLIKHLREKISRMKKIDLPEEFVAGKSFQSDTMKLPFDNNSINHIITSPPFIGNRDFLRMNRIRLWFCGWDYEKQQQVKEQFIENYSDLEIYSNVFHEYYRVLKKNGYCILHLGIVKEIDMAKKLIPIAKRANFNILDIINEDSSKLESHGIRDRGATHTHQLLFLKK